MDLERIPYYVLLAGLVLASLAWLWLVVRAFGTGKGWGFLVLLFPPAMPVFVLLRLSRARAPLALFLLACVVSVSAVVYAKYEERFRTFGPHETTVNGELHITLTGWDGEDYSLLKHRTKAVVLQIANRDVTDETLEHLAGMESLRELDLNGTQVTDKGLAALAALPALVELRLRRTAITDGGFREHLLKKPTLRKLDLIGTKVRERTVDEWESAQPGREALK